MTVGYIETLVGKSEFGVLMPDSNTMLILGKNYVLLCNAQNEIQHVACFNEMELLKSLHYTTGIFLQEEN